MLKETIMKKITELNLLIIIVTTLTLTGCDPGHNGKSFIRNESSYTLQLKFKNDLKDTLILIQPNTFVDFYKFGGLGSGRDYDCCPCEFATISLQPTDTSKIMTKNITDQNNWTMTNPNKRRNSNKEIDCEFTVSQSDIH